MGFNRQKFTVNLRSMWRVASQSWYLHMKDLLTVYAARSEVILQWGDQKSPSIVGSLHLEEVACSAQENEAALGIVPSLLIWHSQLLVYRDFSMMGQMRSALKELCKEQTHSEGLEGCVRLLLRLCPWLTSGAWLFHLNTKDILSWQPLKPCLGAKNQPTTSRAPYSYEWSFFGPHYNHSLFSDHYALPHLDNTVILNRIYIDASVAFR